MSPSPRGTSGVPAGCASPDPPTSAAGTSPRLGVSRSPCSCRLKAWPAWSSPSPSPRARTPSSYRVLRRVVGVVGVAVCPARHHRKRRPPPAAILLSQLPPPHSPPPPPGRHVRPPAPVARQRLARRRRRGPHARLAVEPHLYLLVRQ